MKNAQMPYAPDERPSLQGNPMAAVGMNDDGVTNEEPGECECGGKAAPRSSPFAPPSDSGLDTEDVLGAIFQRMGMQS